RAGESRTYAALAYPGSAGVAGGGREPAVQEGQQVEDVNAGGAVNVGGGVVGEPVVEVGQQVEDVDLGIVAVRLAGAGRRCIAGATDAAVDVELPAAERSGVESGVVADGQRPVAGGICTGEGAGQAGNSALNRRGQILTRRKQLSIHQADSGGVKGFKRR